MGHIFRVYWSRKNANGKRRRTRSKNWYFAYKDSEGVWQRKPGTPDRVATQTMLMEREQQVARGGVDNSSRYVKALIKPLAEHIDEFADDLKNRGNTPVHVSTTKARVTYVCGAGGVETIADITKSAVNKALAKVEAPESEGGLGLSASTRNHYLTAIKGFAQWLKDERRIADNVIDAMKKISTQGKETKERRPLTPEEFAALLKATPTSREHHKCKIDGKQRVALYILAAFTGYRRNELATVTPESFVMDAPGGPVLTVPTDASKRDKPESIPLQLEVAAFFAEYISKLPPGKPLFPIAGSRTADWIRADMKAAGLDVPTGKVIVDFHSLRQNFVTSLILAGVVPKVIQQLARHSTMNLTMNTYGKIADPHERAAVEKLATPLAVKNAHAQAHAHSTLNHGSTRLPRTKHKPKQVAKKKEASASETLTKPRKQTKKRPKTGRSEK